MRPNSLGDHGRRQSSGYFLLTNGRSWGLGLILLLSVRAEGRFLRIRIFSQLDQGVELSLRMCVGRGRGFENPGEASFTGAIVVTWKRQILQVG